jgi:hypothetical protein
MAKTKATVTTEVPEENALVLRNLEKTALSFRERVASIRIRTEEEFTAADVMIHAIRDHYKKVDEVFADDIARAKALAKSLKAKSDKYKKVPEEVEEKLRTEMSRYITEKIRAAEIAAEKEREKQIVKAEKKGDADMVSELEAAPLDVKKVTTESVGGRKTYYAVVVDPKKLPSEYWIVDEARLQREAAALKELFAVPGARVEWKMSAVIR